MGGVYLPTFNRLLRIVDRYRHRRSETGTACRAPASLPQHAPGTVAYSLVSAGVAADQGVVEEVADADGERDDAESGGDPGVGVAGDLGDQAESDDVADGSGAEQDAGSARTSRFR
jgi:hypothetical protein